VQSAGNCHAKHSIEALHQNRNPLVQEAGLSSLAQVFRDPHCKIIEDECGLIITLCLLQRIKMSSLSVLFCSSLHLTFSILIQSVGGVFSVVKFQQIDNILPVKLRSLIGSC